jgi:hypothetical protein
MTQKEREDKMARKREKEMEKRGRRGEN